MDVPPTATSRHSSDMRVTRPDVAFNRHSLNDGSWNSPYDNGMVQVDMDGLRVQLIQGIDEESFKRVLSRGQRAIAGVDLDAPLDTSDWEEVLQGGIQTALESQCVIFEISGASRALTHELVRTRKAVFHQQSQRATFYGNAPEVRMPESVWNNERLRVYWLAAIDAARKAYRMACEADIAYQDARYVLPEGTTNYIMAEYPVREFLATYAYRACRMFLPEIQHAFLEMGRLLVERHPWLAPHVKISCEMTPPLRIDGEIKMEHSRCTFQGYEVVDDQCDFPWGKERFRNFKSERHTIQKSPV